jgi:NitT/TauT family transport system substrate-binding protein
MQMLLSGRVDAALTAEPAATVAQLKGKMSGKAIYRAIDIQAAWGDMTGAAPVLPQAGLALTGTFVEHHGDKLPALLEAIVTATRATIDDPAAAAINATAALGMPAPLLAASIPHCNLVARPATDARDDIERMLSAMAGYNMKKIGGKLPDQEFYLT